MYSRVVVAHVSRIVPGQLIRAHEVERDFIVALEEGVTVVRVREQAVLRWTVERVRGGI